MWTDCRSSVFASCLTKASRTVLGFPLRTAHMLLAEVYAHVQGRRTASIAMILTDQYNLSNTVDELQLADSRLQTSGSG